MGHCLSPCDNSTTRDAYLGEVAGLHETMIGNPEVLIGNITAKMTTLAEAERYEDAGLWRDRLANFLHAAARTQRLRSLTGSEEIIAAKLHIDGWEVHIVRFGRLAAAGIMAPGADAHAWVNALAHTAETVSAGFGPVPAATAHETECVLRWMTSDGVRIVRGEWQTPRLGSERHLPMFEPVQLG